MAWDTIVKSATDRNIVPNLRDYEQARAAFSYREAEKVMREAREAVSLLMRAGLIPESPR